jgi:glucose/arabinose dehydrogenase
MKYQEFLALVTVLTGVDAQAQSIERQRIDGYVPPAGARPIFIGSPSKDLERLFIAEKSGAIRILHRSSGLVNATPVVQVPAANSGESGLLGVAFHPDFDVNRFFYVYYSLNNGRMIRRYRMSEADPDIADPTSATTILFSPVSEVGLHLGGWTAFGPDGELFVSWGNGAIENNSSDITDNLRGKLLRLDVNGPDGLPGTADDDQFPADTNRNYCIPPGNPFIGVEGDDEIWAYGLRNSWRNSFDRLTGEMWVTDVGDGSWEEVNVVAAPPAAAGSNYGYPCFEATRCRLGPPTNCPCLTPSMLFPIHAYDHSFGCAISGGYVYRGCAMPWLYGHYFFADYCRATIWTGRREGNALVDVVDRTEDFWPAAARRNILSFGEDSLGELYICTDGGIFRILPAGAANQCGCGSADFNGDGDFGTDADIDAFFACLAGNCCATCWHTGADFNGDGDTGTDQDIEAFFRVLAGGLC